MILRGQADTIVPNAGDSAAYDRYAYVKNNPVKYTDPNGHMYGDGCRWGGCTGRQYTSYFYNVTHNNNERQINTKKVERIVSGIEGVASIIFEPADWVLTARNCATGNCSKWAAVGLLPIIPASKADDIVYAISKSPRLANMKDTFLGAIRGNNIVPQIGQKHHAISNKIDEVLKGHKTLSGEFSRKDFVFQAFDLKAHIGHQDWHRTYDEGVTKWLFDNPLATRESFLVHLVNIYRSTDMNSRFPNAWKQFQMSLEELR